MTSYPTAAPFELTGESCDRRVTCHDRRSPVLASLDGTTLATRRRPIVVPDLDARPMSSDLESNQFGSPMIYENNQFDFAGRSYRFHHVGITHAAETAMLRAIAAAMEPAVVEARDEQHAVFHLVADDEPGGAYVRAPSRTRKSARVDEAELLGWFEDLTRRGEQPLEELSIADGWFVVDAHPGDMLRLHVGRSKADLDIAKRHERHVVRGPSASGKRTGRTFRDPTALADRLARDRCALVGVDRPAWGGTREVPAAARRARSVRLGA